MEVTAKGGLRHMFHGNYTAAIALMFENEVEVKAAHRILGDTWKVGAAPVSHALVWSGGSEELTALKEKFKGQGFSLSIERCAWSHCKHRCADAEIDGLPHSIDYGPRFTLVIECEDPNQIALF